MKISYRAAGFLVRVCARCAVAVLLFIAALPSGAAQLDIPGPAGSVKFGSSVTVLANSNIVVTDPYALSGAGAVYLYSPEGNLISTLTGSAATDHVGGRVFVVGNSNFVAISNAWSNYTGAVTWVDGATGLNGNVSAGNSLVGTSSGDEIGDVSVLSNGNYLVSSYSWNNDRGAVTWGDGASGVTGAVSASNSLVGTTTGDQVGYSGVTVLSNGNYVVASGYWNNGITDSAFGAVTWGNGASGTVGAISAANSLVGTTLGDYVGESGVVALGNGNYVVRSPFWNNGTANAAYGAATWGNGASGTTGAVSAANSLVGTTVGDKIGIGGVAALSNGNYVVSSYLWNNGVANNHVGAATWSNGTNGTTGAVSTANSLFGTTASDQVGRGVATALSNGNYVVASFQWNGGCGAATWGNGATGTTGAVSASNSLVGTLAGDQVSSSGIVALSNGNYVVSSDYWNNGVANSHFGAATWGNGLAGSTGAVAVANSLFGTTPNSLVGDRVIALSNGNYVVASQYWDDGASNFGAVTWGNGTGGISGAVSAINSLVGTTPDDQVGASLIALANGNYVVVSPYWNNGSPGAKYGATTWGNGASGIRGAVTASNSLIGATPGDWIGYGNGGVQMYADGSYAVRSSLWDNGAIGDAGAVTFGSGKFRLKGTIQSWNSVVGMTTGSGGILMFDYDPARQQFVVGRPRENLVSLFTMDQIFADNFEP